MTGTSHDTQSKWPARFLRSGLPWAAVDQLLVSGAGFVTTVVLARRLGVDAFGLFGFAWALVLFANALQNAAVSGPMLTAVPRQDVEQRHDYVDSIFTLQAILAPLLGAAVVGFGAVVSTWFTSLHALRALALELLLGSVLYQMQDWFRRSRFALQRPRDACVNDAINYGAQLLLILALASAQMLTVSTALLAIGLSSGLALAVGVVLSHLTLKLESLKAIAASLWQDGRHLLLAGQIHWLASQGALLLSADWLGTAGAAAIRSVQNLLGVFNVALSGLDNVVPPTASERVATAGDASLRRLLVRWGLAIGIPFLATSVLLVVFRAQILALLYGKAYVQYAHLVSWGVAFVMLALVVRLLSYYHRALSSTRELSRASALGSLFAIAVVIVSISSLRETALFLSAITSQVVMIAWLLITARNVAAEI